MPFTIKHLVIASPLHGSEILSYSRGHNETALGQGWQLLPGLCAGWAPLGGRASSVRQGCPWIYKRPPRGGTTVPRNLPVPKEPLATLIASLMHYKN